MEDRITNGNEKLKQICLEGGSPCSFPCKNAMWVVIKLDGIQYPEIDNARYCLLQDLHQSYLPEVGASPFGDHHFCLSGVRRREFSSPEGCMYDDNNLLPVSRVGVFLLLRHAKPQTEVFGPHSRRASSAMQP